MLTNSTYTVELSLPSCSERQWINPVYIIWRYLVTDRILMCRARCVRYQCSGKLSSSIELSEWMLSLEFSSAADLSFWSFSIILVLFRFSAMRSYSGWCWLLIPLHIILIWQIANLFCLQLFKHWGPPVLYWQFSGLLLFLQIQFCSIPFMLICCCFY